MGRGARRGVGSRERRGAVLWRGAKRFQISGPVGCCLSPFSLSKSIRQQVDLDVMGVRDCKFSPKRPRVAGAGGGLLIATCIASKPAAVYRIILSYLILPRGFARDG